MPWIEQSPIFYSMLPLLPDNMILKSEDGWLEIASDNNEYEALFVLREEDVISLINELYEFLNGAEDA